MDFRLAFFLATSTLAHAALVDWNSSPAEPVNINIGGAAQALQITLATKPTQRNTASQTAAVNNPAERPAGNPPAARVNRLVAAPKPVPAHDDKMLAGNTAPPVPHPLPQAPARPAPPDQSNSIEISNRISAALRQHLSKHFEYPWLARKRGWQGQVTLSLRIETNGDLTHWKVTRTSGHVLLDESALKCARAINNLPEAVDWLKGQSMDLNVPLQYRLLGS